jgi:hypothetical protein|tara:strand:- start:50 stop:472 length:423 start_codon:yes stop_codon:yes gene_type:complete
MSFPYLKWYQDDEYIFIYILNTVGESTVNIKNNFLEYIDAKYYFNLELFSFFTLKKHEVECNNYLIILNKTLDLCIWDSLLKERTKYKYFINLDWDKYNNYLRLKEVEEPCDEDNMYNEEEFKRLMESGALDEISSDEDN